MIVVLLSSYSTYKKLMISIVTITSWLQRNHTCGIRYFRVNKNLWDTSEYLFENTEWNIRQLKFSYCCYYNSIFRKMWKSQILFDTTYYNGSIDIQRACDICLWIHIHALILNMSKKLSFIYWMSKVEQDRKCKRNYEHS